jgi:four helix bundle protein
MLKKNPIREKSYAFSLDIVIFSEKLIKKKEYVMSKQILKSGTSIGANVEEAMQGQSKRDFIAKLQISLKEASETKFWLRLIRDSGYATQEEVAHLFAQIDEILPLLTSILKSSKRSLIS